MSRKRKRGRWPVKVTEKDGVLSRRDHRHRLSQGIPGRCGTRNLFFTTHDRPPIPALRLQNPQRGTPKPVATYPPAHTVRRTRWVHSPFRRVAGTGDDGALLWDIHDNMGASRGHRGSTRRKGTIEMGRSRMCAHVCGGRDEMGADWRWDRGRNSEI